MARTSTSYASVTSSHQPYLAVLNRVQLLQFFNVGGDNCKALLDKHLVGNSHRGFAPGFRHRSEEGMPISFVLLLQFEGCQHLLCRAVARSEQGHRESNCDTQRREEDVFVYKRTRVIKSGRKERKREILTSILVSQMTEQVEVESPQFVIENLHVENWKEKLSFER